MLEIRENFLIGLCCVWESVTTTRSVSPDALAFHQEARSMAPMTAEMLVERIEGKQARVWVTQQSGFLVQPYLHPVEFPKISQYIRFVHIGRFLYQDEQEAT